MSEIADIREILYRLTMVEKDVERHDDMLLRGNGKPGITTRMQQSEDNTDAIKIDIKTLRNFVYGMVVLCGTTLLSVTDAMAMIIYQGLKR